MALLRLIHLIDHEPILPADDIIREMKLCALRFLKSGLRGGMRPVAKVHQTLHMFFTALPYHGNPAYYTNFIDDSLNKDLGGIAAVAYSSVWAQRIFICWKKVRKNRGRGLLIGMDR